MVASDSVVSGAPGLCGLSGVAYTTLRDMVSDRSPHNATTRQRGGRSLSKRARAAVGAIPRQDQLIGGNASDSAEFFAMGAARRDYVERWPADPVARAVLPARNPFPSGTGCGGPSAKARSASGATVARR
jgi:hypothetical protein